ncbi:MAG: PLP-dependent transferase [Chitinophagales bacterium]|nr:PLP-dependent transferase [Chitinophagales bacterium]
MDDISFILNHLGEERANYFGAVAPPHIQSSNFAFRSTDELRHALLHESEKSLYTRGKNPTSDILCKKIAALAGAESALVLGSGMAAMSTAVLSLVSTGKHVICQQHPYSWTKKLCTKILAAFGVEYTFVDGTDTANIKNAIRPNTTLIILESPNTFTFEIQDLKAVAALAKQQGITTIIDNTYCTSLGQRCIELGIDIEVHSLTKYYSGHSDVVAGCIIGSQHLIEKIFATGFQNIGGILSPHDSWLILRGLRTLPLRLKQVKETTDKVVAFLAQHPRVEKVLYPFHHSFAQHALAQQQMQWCGGLFSIQLKAQSTDEVELFVNNLKAFLLAVSWGGHESLVFPVCAALPKGNYNSHLPFNLIRFYCGLESSDFLIADLKQALNK